MAVKDRDAEALWLHCEQTANAAEARACARGWRGWLAVVALPRRDRCERCCCDGAMQAPLAAEAAVQRVWFARSPRGRCSTKLVVVGAAIMVGGVPVGIMGGMDLAGHERPAAGRGLGPARGVERWRWVPVVGGAERGYRHEHERAHGVSAREERDADSRRGAGSRRDEAPTAREPERSSSAHSMQTPSAVQTSSAVQTPAANADACRMQTPVRNAGACRNADRRPRYSSRLEQRQTSRPALVRPAVGSRARNRLLCRDSALELALGALRNRDSAAALRAVEPTLLDFSGLAGCGARTCAPRALHLSGRVTKPRIYHD